MTKDEAIQAAADHADRTSPNWTSQAYQKALLAMLSLNNRGITQFQIHDVRETIRVFFKPLPEPPTERAWGWVTQQLIKDGQIKQVGYGPTKNKKAHNAIAAIYEKL